MEKKELIILFSSESASPRSVSEVTKAGGIAFLPDSTVNIILPFGSEPPAGCSAEIIYRVCTTQEAMQAVAQKVPAIAIRESDITRQETGERMFDIFRRVVEPATASGVRIYVQGNVGVHAAAAFLALGADGIIFEESIACFPECAPSSTENTDTALAEELAGRYRNLRGLIAAVREAAHGHNRQAKRGQVIDLGEPEESSVAAGIVTGGELRAPVSLWERQIMEMLRREKNLSKYTLRVADENCDPFFAAFVSVMAASVAAKGIRVEISAGKPGLEEREALRKLLPQTKHILAGLPDIPPIVPAPHSVDIAVVGMDCVYPGAANVDQYWMNILSGRDCVGEVPASHWDKEALFRSETTDTDYSNSKWGGFISPTEFDPVEFGIIPQSLFMTEPSHLLSLLVAKRALKDAGYDDPVKCDLENTSVFFGGNSTSNPLASRLNARFRVKQADPHKTQEGLKEAFPKANEYSFTGILSNLLTGRIANRLNLGGRNYTVDAACASSLASLDVACQELSTWRADMVVYGGADLTNTYGPYLMFSSVGVLSPKGYCSPFDADADGIVMGEGVGAVILKRLEDAERDGNKIYAVIKGIGGSSDGRNLGLTAPSRKGEGRAIERAYRSAGMLPSEAGMIEAHGTGTVVGDRVELATLTDLMLDAGALPGQTFIGSVKSQIGHTKCAAGVGALIRTALSVYHGVIPPTLHLEKPNAYHDRATSPFVFHRRAGVWNTPRRVAGISAFGFGGTNFHAVMENYGQNTPEAASCSVWPAELFVFRGETLEEAKLLVRKVKRLLASGGTIRMSDLAYTLATLSDGEVQVSIVASGAEGLLAKMDAVLEGRSEIRIWYRKVREGGVAFLFPGQGSQRVDMARDLFVAFPPMRRLLDRHSEYTRVLFPETAFDNKSVTAQERAMIDTTNAQPVLGIVDLAIADYLRFLGITPDAVAGHSYGELPALCFAGTMTPDELVALSRARAEAIQGALGDDRGKMAVVLAGESKVNSLLEGETDVWAVNYNSPGQTALSGTSSGIGSIIKKAAERNILCRAIEVDCAFHSPLVAGSEKEFAATLSEVEFRVPEITVWTATTAEPYPLESGAIRDILSYHLNRPLHFGRQIENMYASGIRVFIETGPGRVLTGLVDSILGERATAIQTENQTGDGITTILRALGQYLSLGKSFHIEKLFDGRGTVRLDLDNPDLYRPSPTGWLIDGSGVYPANGNKIAE